MGGITAYDFTSSVAYREIFRLGYQQGEQKGRQAGLQEGQEQRRQVEAVALTLRLLEHRCGALTPSQRGRFQAFSPTALDRYGSWHEATAKQALGRVNISTRKRHLTNHLQKL